MDNKKIQIRLIFALASLFLIAFKQKSYAQDLFVQEMLNKAYDLNDDSGKLHLTDRAIYIVVNNKNCTKCFEDVCQYLKHHNDTSYKYYGLIITHKNYLNLIPLTQKYQPEIGCASAFYFYFITENQNYGISQICDMPSPQLIIKTGENYKYLDYKATLSLVGD